jgi:D-proline reductase (dithiol) PrdB
MTRLTDLPPAQAQRLAELECPDFSTRPWVTGPALPQRRVAIVSSAGLVVRGEDPFRGRDADYRAIPGDTQPKDLLISHISINFDRAGFQEDWNVVFPLDRLNELAADGARRGRANPLLIHGRYRSGADGAACQGVGRPAQGRPGRRRHSLSRLTALHARRERAGALSGGRRLGDGRDQPDPASNREDPAAAGALGPI